MSCIRLREWYFFDEMAEKVRKRERGKKGSQFYDAN